MKFCRSALVTTALTLCTLLPTGLVQAQDYTTEDDVHEVNDLAGILTYDDSSEGQLTTTAADESGVLSALKAVPIGRDWYEARIHDNLIRFTVLRVAYPGYFLPAGDLLCQTQWVRVYRGTCRATLSGGNSGCFPYNGAYARLNYSPVAKCKKSPTLSYCVEVKQISWTRTLYFDPFCTQAIGVQTGLDFRCN